MVLRSYAETFPGTPDQVARVRREVRAYLDGCPAADDVVLIVSELVSNAIMHSLSRVGTFSVCVQIHPAYIYAEVEDDGGPWYCPQQDGRPHGLEVVTLLTRRDWGTDPVGDGHRAVWARIQHPCCGIQAAGPPIRRTEAGSPPVPPPGVPLPFLLLNEKED
jgi:anti-sigma regulatory factor (Ser/Thr protein kinase)